MTSEEMDFVAELMADQIKALRVEVTEMTDALRQELAGVLEGYADALTELQTQFVGLQQLLTTDVYRKFILSEAERLGGSDEV